MSINLEQLAIFLAVAEHRSFTRAAESLYISHSTTSRNVSALEEELGVLLLTRDNRSVRLTPAGEVLCREGARLLRTVESVEDMVRNAGLGFGRSLSIATIRLVPEKLRREVVQFCQNKPEVRVGILRREPSEIWKLVDTGEADLGITSSSALPENWGNMERLSLGKEGLSLLTGASDPMSKTAMINVSDIVGRELVCDPSTSRFITPELRSRNSVVMLPSVDSVFLRVSTGNACAIVPNFCDGALQDECVFTPINAPSNENLVLIWNRISQNPSLAGLLKMIRENLDL